MNSNDAISNSISTKPDVDLGNLRELIETAQLARTLETLAGQCADLKRTLRELPNLGIGFYRVYDEFISGILAAQKLVAESGLDLDRVDMAMGPLVAAVQLDPEAVRALRPGEELLSAHSLLNRIEAPLREAFDTLRLFLVDRLASLGRLAENSSVGQHDPLIIRSPAPESSNSDFSDDALSDDNDIAAEYTLALPACFAEGAAIPASIVDIEDLGYALKLTASFLGCPALSGIAHFRVDLHWDNFHSVLIRVVEERPGEYDDSRELAGAIKGVFLALLNQHLGELDDLRHRAASDQVIPSMQWTTRSHERRAREGWVDFTESSISNTSA